MTPTALLADASERDLADDAPLLVNCVIFSRDRAMQLDACLRSIERLAPYDGQITVIWKATGPEFESAYRLLAAGSHAHFKAQTPDFRSDVIGALDAQRAYTAFSLRLGTNTTYCYPFRRSQQLPAIGTSGPFIAWDWTRADADFSYPLSLDGHLVHTKHLLQILSRASFTNPNELEEELHLRRYRVPHTMLAFQESCLVSIPINIVSPTHRNPAGSDPETSPPALNTRFLAGERIDFDAMDFSTVRGAHQEIPLVFRTVDSNLRA
jgi:hypothetical protein